MSPLIPLHETLVKYCQDIYTDDHLSIHEHIDNKTTGVQCMFIMEDNRLIICYRGSNDSTDWRMNFHMSQSEYPCGSGCYVHSGFLVQWISIEKEFKEKLTSHLEKNKETGEIQEVVFCGHSAGSGQCCLAAYSCDEIIKSYGVPMKVVTFASPMMGDENFKEKLESLADCTRIVLDRDVITRVPFFGYIHVGKPIQIREDCILERETSMLEHIHWMILGARSSDIGINDHFVWNYYGAIKKWLHNNK